MRVGEREGNESISIFSSSPQCLGDVRLMCSHSRAVLNRALCLPFCASKMSPPYLLGSANMGVAQLRDDLTRDRYAIIT